jgi:hypothetical protein
MPQEYQRSDNQRTEQSGSESARAGRSRSQRSPAEIAQELSFSEMGARGVTAGLRLQKEMFGVLSDIGHEWFARAASQAEFASELPNKLTAARSVPDAVSAYQEWLGKCMTMAGEDSYRFISDSQRIINAGVRCFAEARPSVTNWLAR